MCFEVLAFSKWFFKEMIQTLQFYALGEVQNSVVTTARDFTHFALLDLVQDIQTDAPSL